MLALLDKGSQAILGALLALLTVLAKDFIVHAQLLSILLSLSRLFLSPSHARRTLRLGLLDVRGEAGDVFFLDGGIDDLAETLLVLQHVAEDNIFEDGVHVALALLVSDEEVVLLFVRALVLLRKLGNGVGRDSVFILLAVKVAPIEAVGVDYRLRSRARRIVALAARGVRENGIRKGDGLERFLGLFSVRVGNLVCVTTLAISACTTGEPEALLTGVVAQGSLAVGLLDVVGRCFLLDAQGFIGINSRRVASGKLLVKLRVGHDERQM